MQSRSNNRVGAAALTVALAALTLAAFAVFYHRQVGTVNADTAVSDAGLTNLMGLTRGEVKNALDPQYADADGDLVADPPTDPAKQVDPATLTFCYVTADRDVEFKAAFNEVMAAVSKATGKPVRYVAYGSIPEKLRALRAGKLSFCGLNTGSVPLAVCTAGFVPLCQAADADGRTGSPMKVIVPADSTLSALTDLRGHELALTEPTSNSGFRAPLVQLREAGLLPPRDFQVRFSNGHVQSIQGIKDKRFEAAAVAGDVLLREQSGGQIGPADYKVIYTSDQAFPAAAIGCAHDLKPELVAKIRQALLGFDWTGTGLARLFAAEGKVKFVPVDYKKDWAYVRQIDNGMGYAYALPAGSDAPAATQPTTTMPAK